MLFCLPPGFDDFNLSLHSDMASVAKAMASPESGLEVRDRMWLKITIPNAFLGKTTKWRQKQKKESITFMNSVCLRGLYRGSIMFSELKPCDLWEGKKSPKYRLECLCWLETCVKLESPAAESQGVITGNYKYFVLFEIKMLFMIWIQVHVVKIQHVTDQQAKTKWSPAVNNTLAFFVFFLNVRGKC